MPLAYIIRNGIKRVHTLKVNVGMCQLCGRLILLRRDATVCDQCMSDTVLPRWPHVGRVMAPGMDREDFTQSELDSFGRARWPKLDKDSNN